MADPRAAVRSALAAYLATELASYIVLPEWPKPQQKLAKGTVTVLSSENMQSEYHTLRLWRTTPTTGVNGTAMYSYGRAEINMQIDCWETYPARRDALASLLESSLNRDPKETLDPDPTRVLGFRRKPGLVLSLGDYFDTPCEFIFAQPPGLNEGGRDLVSRSVSPSVTGDWRATFTGRAILHLLDQDAVALMQTVTMKLGINGASVDVPLAP